ncbi:MAG: hypothetical protein U0M12_05760 [Acutalibacteraceae bacterium]|nr:hypothetical protein [Acutalibacteraceae bacterium]
MTEIIATLVVTAVFYIGGYLFLGRKTPFSDDKKAFLSKVCFVGGINILAYVFLVLYIMLFTTVKSTHIFCSFVLVALLVFAGFVVCPFLPKEKTRYIVKGCAIVCAIPLLLEVFIFNAKSFDTQKVEFIPTSITTETSDTVIINGSNVSVYADGNIIINVEQSGLGAVEMDLSSSDSNFVCTASMTDGNYETKYITVEEKSFSVNTNYASFSIEPYETLKSFKLEFSDVDGIVDISNIKFSSALPFEFSNTRFFMLSIILTGIYLVYSMGLYKITYRENSFNQSMVITAVIMMCAISAFLFLTPDGLFIDYSTANIDTADPYVQMFDAVQKGQLNIDVSVSEEFKALENPYDWQQRIDSGLSYAWDRAYYEGNYYSYFGIVPVFVLYYPCYFLTGMLPSLNLNIFVFSICSIVFMMTTILTFVKLFIKKPNFLLLLIGMISAVSFSGIYYALDFSDIYFPAKASGICFMLLCVWLGLLAYKKLKEKSKWVLLLFAGSGLSFVLCVGCRPSVAVSALILAPVFIAVLANKDYKLNEKIKYVTSFMLPIIVGGVGLLWYNNARFGSPFDFGTSYQLTVSNVGANKLNLNQLPNAILHYFLQPFAFTSEFPFFEAQTISLDSYGRYIYCDSFFGVINFPAVFLGIIVAICVVVHDRKKSYRLTEDNNIKYFSYLAMLIIAVFTAWSDFCLAGVAFGYMLDILPILSILAVLVYLDIQGRLNNIPQIQNKVTAIFACIMAFTVVIMSLHLLTYSDRNLLVNFPNIKETIENIFVFWR